MKTLLLALALPLAACGFDCPSAGPFNTVDAFQRVRAEPTLADTMVVVVESRYFYIDDVYVALGADVPRVSESGSTEVLVTVEYSTYEAEAERVPRLSAETLGDTVVVRAPDGFAVAAPPCGNSEGVVQAVCSYAEPTFTLFIEGVHAPETVRHVTYLRRDAFGRLAPLSRAASSAEARTLRGNRTARG